MLSMAQAIAGGDAAMGRALYQARCSVCHSVDYNGVGPAHKGVFGRRIGTAPDFEYSPALRNATGYWTAENLDRWLTDPEKFLPGQRMNFSLESAQDRANVIEYLKSLSTRE
ncbi:MAG: c-type cytochrome [Proteobacteria bacterium]|nr:c-type cytochrome [Pseudomonadota bacterium]